MTRSRIFLTVVSLLGACLPVQAQTSGSSGSSPGGEEILFQELPSVFGASKYEQKPSEAPASVSIITADEIEKYGYRTLADILRSVRGFYATNDRNYTYLGARGYDRPGDYNSRELLLIDGHRVNDDIYDSALFGTESLVDVGMIDRVEVIRGPSSSLYGTSAVLAVINIITRSGRSLKGTEIAADAASYGTGKGRVSYGNKFANGAELFATGSYYNSAGQTLFFPGFNDPSTNNGISTHSDNDGARAGFAKLTFGNWALESGYNTRTKRIPTGAFGIDFNNPISRTTDARGYLSLRYDGEVSPQSRVAGEVAYDYYHYYGNYAYTDPVLGLDVLKDWAYGRWWSANGQYIHTSRDRHKTILGVDYRYNAQQDQGTYDTTPYLLTLDDHRHSAIYAFFAQDEYRVSKRFMINGGVRYDHYETFGGTTNPRVAFIVNPGAGATLKAIYGRAFRAPNYYELFYQDNFTQEANPNLQAEKIDTYELTWEQSLGHGLRSVVSVYRYDINGLISQAVDPNTGFFFFDNLERVRAEGAEAELEGRLAARLDGRISYAYQDAYDVTTGALLTNSPRHLAKLNLSAALVRDRFWASLETQYMSRRQTLQGPAAGAVGLTNLVFLGRFGKSGLSITAGAYNLFDKQYADPGGDEHVTAGVLVIPQDGRNYRFQIKFQF